MYLERRILIRKGTKSLYDYCQENSDKLYLLEEWDYKKNKESGLTPESVGRGSDKKVWWYLPYNDPKTGKHFDFEWQSPIFHRTNGSGCPYLSNQAVWQGFNDLATLNPELAKEWHPTKNGDLKPENVIYGGKRSIWWQCKYGHEWKTSIQNRIKGDNCPVCGLSGTSYSELALYYYISLIYPDALHRNKQNGYELDIFIPSINTAIEYDSSYYHDNKIEIENKKDLSCKKHGIRLIRLRSNKLQPTVSAETIWLNGETFIKVSEGIQNLFNYLEIKYNFEINIDNDYEKIIDMKKLKELENSLLNKKPEIAAEWHPTKNGNLTPDQFTYQSNIKIWWLLPYDDPQTGKHFDFEWQSTINHRTNGKGCPFLSGQAVFQGFNDLATKSPSLAAKWHPTKNGNLKPTDVTIGSNKRVWWQCPVCGHEWTAIISSRTHNKKCPHCKTL